MTRRVVTLVVSVLVALAAPPGTRVAAQQPAFRSGVDLVSLNITVADQTGRFVTDLEPTAFQVFEDGVKQEVTFFNRSNLPIALSLLLDTSASMEDKLTTAQEAAVGFARKLRTLDLAQVVDFDSRVSIAQAFTSNVSDLETAIRKTSPGGSTSLHNAIYIALKELKKVQARSSEDIRRQAIVVLSDGEDTSSLVSFDEVLELAKRSETAIYAIGLRSRGPERARGSFNESDFVLAPTGAGNGREGLLRPGGHGAHRHLRTDFRRALEPVHGRLQLEKPQTRRRLAPHRRSRPVRRRNRTHQAGLLRANLVDDVRQPRRHGEHGGDTEWRVGSARMNPDVGLHPKKPFLTLCVLRALCGSVVGVRDLAYHRALWRAARSI